MQLSDRATTELRWVDGGVTAARGFRASGVRCGIKAQGEDLALVFSDFPCSAAGVFTTNQVKAAPVLLSRERVKVGCARAIVANSGNANACTGQQGLRDAEKMAAVAAAELGLAEHEVLVASTGIIGRRLPMEKVLHGIPAAAQALSADGGPAAARAIMTTDTRPKLAAVEFPLGGKPVRIGGIAKGAGMICPQVATFFCFLTTDADISAEPLQRALGEAADASFNCLTVDGDGSSNDTVIVLANGASRAPLIADDSAEFNLFQEALTQVCISLAKQIAADGEGATKLVEVRVINAASEEAARTVAKSIANSPLVKTAIFGQDPNWGRVLVAAGKCGIEFDPNKADLSFGDVTVFEDGAPVDLPQEKARKPLLEKEVLVTLDLNAGRSSATVWTCDFTYDYVRINAEYHT